MPNDEDDDDVQIMSTAEVAAELGISEREARSYARANGLPRVGVAFAWSPDAVDDLADSVAEEDDEDDEDDGVRHVEVEGELDEYELDDEEG